MKTEENTDGQAIRRILGAMATDLTTLSKIAVNWKPDSFAAKWSNLLGGWCVDHLHKHGGVPGTGLASYFYRWAERTRDEATKELMEKFLSAVSQDLSQAEPVNASLMVDEAGHHFNMVRMKRTVDQAQAHLTAGNPEEARKSLTEYAWMEMGGTSTIDFFLDDDDSWADPANEVSLIEYPGDMRHWFHGYLTRDSLVVLFAPIKTGKSFVLVDMAVRAAYQRKKVAYFDVGDNSKAKFLRRLNIRVAGRPTRSKTGFPCTIDYPQAIAPPSTNFYTNAADFEPAKVSFKAKNFKHALNAAIAKEARARILEEIIKTKKRSYLKCEIHPNYSISVKGIQTILHRWKIEGWEPDIVVIDYADILANSPGQGGKMDKRDQINTIWMELRRLSQENHCLVLTASQTNKESFTRVLLDRRNFSEDLRKMAHATAIMGLNLTSKERKVKTMRYNWILGRDEDYSPGNVIHVATCLALAQPCVTSVFPTKEQFAEDEMPKG